MFRLLAAASALALTLPVAATANEGEIAKPHAPSMTYPETRREDLVETIFGQDVADPYRWLEQDVRNSEEVAEWVERQSTFTANYLEQLPERDWFAAELARLLNYERVGTPEKAGDYLLYSYNPGLADQNVLMIKPADSAALDAKGKVLIDPSIWSDDGTVALAGWDASPGGRTLAYRMQEGGSDWNTLKFLDIESGVELADELNWLKVSGAVWIDDESFLYARFPAPEAGEDFQVRAENSMIYQHVMGQPQSADRLIYATPDNSDMEHSPWVSDDGRWAVIMSTDSTAFGNQLRVISLTDPEREPIVVSSTMEAQWVPVMVSGDKLLLKTDLDAPRYRIVSFDLSDPDAPVQDVIPQGEDNIVAVMAMGERLAVHTLQDVKSRLALYDLDGTLAADVQLPGIGSVDAMSGDEGQSEAWISFSSFNRPSEVLRLDLATGETSPASERALNFDPDAFVVEQVFYPSKDGTKIPMFIVKREDIVGPAPTLLYAYGGFNVSLTPGYSSTRMAWLQAGGVYALANIRGGGEYGSAWHEAATGPRRVNAFNDFIAAGEWLKANGVTGEKQLAIQGGSNGGLLMGVVTNMRPDLFDAVNAQVGVMDMLRFTRWGYGQSWTVDFGDPAVEDEFQVLRGYSPYHNIPETGVFPPILVTTADTDDRVIPGHSFKYAAALQHADLGDAPHLIRIETKAGHGAGKPISKIIEENADIEAFLAHWTRLVPGDNTAQD